MSLTKICMHKARESLLADLDAGGVWCGHLTSSALSTALAAFALHTMDGPEDKARADRAGEWLLKNRNADGGWGDSPQSPSNRSTTLIVWAVLGALKCLTDTQKTFTENWLIDSLGDLEPASIRAKLLADYGEDKTFSVPILTLLALTGKVSWQMVPQLPFELAVCPRQIFRWLRLPVVSYALPALIAIGLVRHRQTERKWHPWRHLRDMITPLALRRLRRIQPADGGFLEAAPLTAFVLMSLVGAGESRHPVSEQCADFLRTNQRKEGSWPIDTNLATWLTSLSVDALMAGPVGIPEETADKIRAYLLSAQMKVRHPFTGAAPGGWAWTHLPGGVPDADDTAAGLSALRHLSRPSYGSAHEVKPAARRGLVWLLNLQNLDGGMPTFCRGWGRFPFDRSCPDITAHALKAVTVWSPEFPGLKRRLSRFSARALGYLQHCQGADGSWLPLWFGNQQTPDGQNPVYGTAQVVSGLAESQVTHQPLAADLIAAGRRFLRTSQNPDGGWGGRHGAASTIEETAMALRALGETLPKTARDRSTTWLAVYTQQGTHFPAAPIGLYFSRLWYAEKLYPLIHLAALT